MGIYTQTGYSTGLTLSEIVEQIMFNIGHVKAGSPVYTRIPYSVVLGVINTVQRELAVLCPSIRKMCIVNTTADKGWYLCPSNMIPNGIIAAYYYISDDHYQKLKIWDREKVDYEYGGWREGDSRNPEVIMPGHTMYGNRLTFEVYPKPDTGGSWTAAEPGVYLGGAPGTTTTSVTGLATGGSTTTLTDTEVDFTTLGLAAGMAVWNVTDNGYGYIKEGGIATNTLTLVSAMTNSAQFDAGDSYEIVTDFTGVISDWDDDDEQYIFSSELGTISDLQPNAYNIYLEYFAYPINLTILTDYPQLTPVLQDVLVDRATSRVAKMGHEKTRQMQLSAMYEAMAQQKFDPFYKAAYGQPFSDMQRRVVVRMKGRGRVR